VESAKLFYEHLRDTLFSFGFVQNAYDNCIFNISIGGVQCTIAAHVDDLLITCVDGDIIEKVINHLENVYKEIKVNRGMEHSYLGMNLLVKDNNAVTLDMEKMVETIISDYGIFGTASTPAVDNLFVTKIEDILLSDDEKEKFHSFTAKLLYLGRKVRPDILTAVSYLTTRVTKPTVTDKLKLERVLKYLNGSKTQVMTIGNVFDSDGSITIKCYIDTSHGIHDDMRGHIGCIMAIGNSNIVLRSTKMKINTKATAETELIGMSEEASQALWMKYWLEDNGYKVNPIILYQDNMSTIAMIKKGKPCSRSTRHIKMRYFFIKDYMNMKIMDVRYLKTDDMLADMLTKPLQGKKFKKFAEMMLNCYI
jgi:hypothetical protein